MTCSKDGRTRNWNLELDLLGDLNPKVEKIDPYWSVKTKMKSVKREKEVRELEILLDDIALPLDEKRKRLIVDES
jgi:hypothetical protein